MSYARTYGKKDRVKKLKKKRIATITCHLNDCN